MNFEFDKVLHEYLARIVISIIIIILAAAARFITKRLILRYGVLNSKIENRTRHIIRLLTVLINSTALLILIVLWGVSPESLFAILTSVIAIIGVALFAQWSLLSNVTAGIIIFFSSPYKVGDYIRVMDREFPLEARVTDILSFHTHLKTQNGELHVFPNSLMLQKAISVISGPTHEEELDDDPLEE